MRRLTGVLLGAILSLALVSTAQAQIALGIKGGVNSSKITVNVDGTSVDTGLKSLIGFNAGADLAFGFSPMFGIEVGGVYSQKGAKEDGGDGKVAFDVIDVPVLLAVSIPTEGSVTPRLFAGGVGSFKLSCKIKEGGASADCSDADVGAPKSFYISLLFGAGIGFAAGPGSLVLDVGYQLGLTNIIDEEIETVKVNVIQASLGYRFPIGG